MRYRPRNTRLTAQSAAHLMIHRQAALALQASRKCRPLGRSVERLPKPHQNLAPGPGIQEMNKGFSGRCHGGRWDTMVWVHHDKVELRDLCQCIFQGTPLFCLPWFNAGLLSPGLPPTATPAATRGMLLPPTPAIWATHDLSQFRQSRELKGSSTPNTPGRHRVSGNLAGWNPIHAWNLGSRRPVLPVTTGGVSGAGEERAGWRCSVNVKGI